MGHNKLHKTLQSLLDIHNKVFSNINVKFTNDLENNIIAIIHNTNYVLIAREIYMFSPFHNVQRRLTQKLKTYKF